MYCVNLALSSLICLVFPLPRPSSDAVLHLSRIEFEIRPTQINLDRLNNLIKVLIRVSGKTYKNDLSHVIHINAPHFYTKKLTV